MLPFSTTRRVQRPTQGQKFGSAGEKCNAKGSNRLFRETLGLARKNTKDALLSPPEAIDQLSLMKYALAVLPYGCASVSL